MNLLGVLAQAFFDQEARTQAERWREAGHRAAEKGRRVATAIVFFTVSGAFFFSGLLLALIDLGLQIDRREGLFFSGLMVSSSLLVMLGLFCAFGGWLSGRDPQAGAVPPPPPPPPQSELRVLLEELAVVFLKDFVKNQKASRAQAPE